MRRHVRGPMITRSLRVLPELGVMNHAALPSRRSPVRLHCQPRRRVRRRRLEVGRLSPGRKIPHLGHSRARTPVRYSRSMLRLRARLLLLLVVAMVAATAFAGSASAGWTWDEATADLAWDNAGVSPADAPAP